MMKKKILKKMKKFNLDIYKPFLFMFYLLFNFTYAMIKLLAKLGYTEARRDNEFINYFKKHE